MAPRDVPGWTRTQHPWAPERACFRHDATGILVSSRESAGCVRIFYSWWALDVSDVWVGHVDPLGAALKLAHEVLDKKIETLIALRPHLSKAPDEPS